MLVVVLVLVLAVKLAWQAIKATRVHKELKTRNSTVDRINLNGLGILPFSLGFEAAQASGMEDKAQAINSVLSPDLIANLFSSPFVPAAIAVGVVALLAFVSIKAWQKIQACRGPPAL